MSLIDITTFINAIKKDGVFISKSDYGRANYGVVFDNTPLLYYINADNFSAEVYGTTLLNLIFDKIKVIRKDRTDTMVIRANEVSKEQIQEVSKICINKSNELYQKQREERQKTFEDFVGGL